MSEVPLPQKLAPEDPAPLPFMAPCRELAVSAPLRWVRLGWQDFRRAPRQSLGYGAAIVLLSWLVTGIGLKLGSYWAALVLLSGFDVYHELAFPHEVLASIIRALKPGGQLVFVEYRAEDPQVPIKALHKMSEAQIKREAAVHALVWERTVGTLPWQHLVVFRKRG
jgi:SAM-dependent methyltransferase